MKNDEAIVEVKEETKEEVKKDETKKSGSFFKTTLAKTTDTGKKVFESVKTTTQNISEQNKEKRIISAKEKEEKKREERFLKYSPLFPEEYQSKKSNLPNLLIIVDDAERKGIDVCEGAIGWLSKEKDVEVLHLYDEALEFSGLQFVPAPICDSAYYVDLHNRNTYINLDCYFSNAQEEKLAELQHIAYSLGAKKYRVEIIESKEEKQRTKVSANLAVKAIGTNASNNTDYASASSIHTKVAATASFGGKRAPTMPKLSWFAHDKNVLNLIDMRCSNNAEVSMEQYTIEISNQSSASMTLSTASKVNAAANKLKLNCDFSKKSEEEHSRKMLFILEF